MRLRCILGYAVVAAPQLTEIRRADSLHQTFAKLLWTFALIIDLLFHSFLIMENNAAEILLSEHRNEKRKSAAELREHRGVYLTRLFLRVCSLLTCALILFSLIDALRNHRRTKDVRNSFHEGSGSFPVWPEKEGLKLYPTYILLGAATVAGVLSIVLIVASFTKSVSTSVQ